MSQIFLLL